jgi:acetyl esterase/lipase
MASIVLARLRWLVEQYALRIVQLYFDWPIYYLKRMWNWFEHGSHDGENFMAYVKLTRSVHYGSGRLERYNVLEPVESDGRPALRGVVFNVHGGGFACSMDECYYPSMSATARQGFIVIGIDYPTSPQARSPEALVCVLKAICHATASFKRDRPLSYHMIGDSAGANLVGLAAAVMRNGSLLEQLAKCSGDPTLTAMEFPEIASVTSLYGMVDQVTCRDNPDHSLATRGVNAALRFLWAVYAGPSPSSFPLTFFEAIPSIKALPPMLFCCGDGDFLVESTRICVAAMEKQQLQVRAPPFPSLLSRSPPPHPRSSPPPLLPSSQDHGRRFTITSAMSSPMSSSPLFILCQAHLVPPRLAPPQNQCRRGQIVLG